MTHASSTPAPFTPSNLLAGVSAALVQTPAEISASALRPESHLALCAYLERRCTALDEEASTLTRPDPEVGAMRCLFRTISLVTANYDAIERGIPVRVLDEDHVHFPLVQEAFCYRKWTVTAIPDPGATNGWIWVFTGS